jgi:hypothetical protein
LRDGFSIIRDGGELQARCVRVPLTAVAVVVLVVLCAVAGMMASLLVPDFNDRQSVVVV